jgi:hypothetical protein
MLQEFHRAFLEISKNLTIKFDHVPRERNLAGIYLERGRI